MTSFIKNQTDSTENLEFLKENEKIKNSNLIKMSISPSFSSANSNQSSATSSLNSLNENQEDISSLTNYVKNFREQLSKLRRFINLEINLKKDHIEHDNLIEKQEIFKAQVHHKLADVLRVLKTIFEKYPQIKSNDLINSSKSLIDKVKGFAYTDQAASLTEIIEKIEQLAASFSNRVSEYLIEGETSLNRCLPVKTKSSVSFDCPSKNVCDNNNNFVNQQSLPLTSNNYMINNSNNSDFLWNSVYNMFHKRVFSDSNTNKKDDCNVDNAEISLDDCDSIFTKMNEAVESILQNAKSWSKFTKDVTVYIEKRINFEMDNSKNLLKLAQTIKPNLKESEGLPFQDLYIKMLDQDIKNHKAYFANCSLILGHKFIEPLNDLRNEHEKIRKACKSQWTREYKKFQDSLAYVKKARSNYVSKKMELDRAKQALKVVLETGSITSSHHLYLNHSPLNQNVITTFPNNQLNFIHLENSSEQIKIDKKRKYEEEATTKAIDAENIYRNAVIEANERAKSCENVKKTIISRIRDLNFKYDLTLKSVTGNYLQIQQLVTSAEPIDFQSLLKNVQNYVPDTSFSDYLSKLNQTNQNNDNYFFFLPYNELSRGSISMSFDKNSDYESNAESVEGNFNINSSNKEANLTKNYKSKSKLGKKHKNISKSTKVAQTHHFKTVRTLSKCKECDIINFQGLECIQCGICIHKKCIQTLTIKCGLKPLIKKGNTFNIDLCSQSVNNEVPYLVKKCIQEINRRGLANNGIYRVSGVKSQVEKLCQDFELGEELVDLSNISPTVLTSVLKYYFRQLPEPLLTFRLYGEFILIGKRYPTDKLDLISNEDINKIISNSSSQSLLKELKHAINKLPEIHLNTLDYLMKHLKKVSDNNQNNMPANNLGIVFGPTLLRANEGATSLSTLEDTVYQNRVIELLIINYNELFGGNLVEDNDYIEEIEEINDSSKTITFEEEDDEDVDDEEEEEDEEDYEEEDDEDDDEVEEIEEEGKQEKIIKNELDDLIKDLNINQLNLGSKNTLFKDSEESGIFSKHYSKDSIEKKIESNLSKSNNTSRPSLNELRRQFFTETCSPNSFNSFNTSVSEERLDKHFLDDKNLNAQSEKNFRDKLLTNVNLTKPCTSKLNFNANSILSINQNVDLANAQNQSKSPSSSTLHLLNSEDDNREPKFV